MPIRQEITRVFKEYGLGITIIIDKKEVNFLDITLDLKRDNLQAIQEARG